MNDFFGIAGLGLIGVGTYFRFGWELSSIICGTLLLTLAVIGAIR